MHRWLASVLAIVFAGCTAVSPAPARAADDSPPLIAGRISFVEGDSRIWRVEEDAAGEWDEAIVNDVVSPGTGLYTGSEGRNEVRVGPHTFRLGSASRGGFSQLDYSSASFNVEYGTLNVRLARPEHGERFEVTASNVRLDLVAPGRYRVDVADNGPVRLTVFEGHATVRGPSNALGVSAAQAIVVEPGGGSFNFEQAITTDFDNWAVARDDRFAQVRSAQYVSPYMTGYEELDTYGDWIPDVTYGTVWVPRVVPVGWAPYRNGQWRWVRPWGWTWVDYAPWGYAPFHYGRWVYVGHRWCWWPGGYVRRPVWGPAFVGFVGSSAGDRIWGGVRGPLVGWYPLAPWHRYQPHYRHNPTYVTVINQTIINAPPRGVPPTVNHGPGSTMVPGPRFREPVPKVALVERPRVDELKAAAPPPRTIAPAPRMVAPAPRAGTPKIAETNGRTPEPRMVQPGRPVPAPQAGSPPTRVSPPMVAEPLPGRGVASHPALPGNDPAPLAQPPKFKQPPPQARPQPVAPPPAGDRPRARMPSELEPQAQPRPINPAEPARTPPGAPPTVRQPAMVPAARPVQTAPVPVASPAPRQPAIAPAARPVQTVPTPAAPEARPAPAVPVQPPAARHTPAAKEQAINQAVERAESGKGSGPGRMKSN